MDNLGNEFISIHQEVIRREVSTRQLLRKSGMVNPNLVDRGLTLLGDSLIHLGTRLKNRSYTRLTAEETAAPSFLIML